MLYIFMAYCKASVSESILTTTGYLVFKYFSLTGYKIPEVVKMFCRMRLEAERGKAKVS